MVGFRIRFTQPTGDRSLKSQQSSKIASVEGIKAGDSASEKCGIGNQVVPRPLILGQSRPLSRRRPQSTMNPNPVEIGHPTFLCCTTLLGARVVHGK
jgi:hypothetical protein